MNPKKEGIMSSRTKEHVGKETSSQNAPIIQEPLPIGPVVYHQRSGSRSRPKLAARLTKEMVVVTANMRAISWQNTVMCKLLRRMQSQLARSSQNEEIVPLEIGVNVDTITNYDTGRITHEAVVLVEGSRANAPRVHASVFDSLSPTRDKEGWPPIPPAQTGSPLISSNKPHLFDSFSEENQHGQPQPRTANELALRHMHPSPRNRRERRAALARMRTYLN